MTETMTYTSLDQLPITLRADELAAVLGISRAGAYTLMRSKGFPTIFIGHNDISGDIRMDGILLKFLLHSPVVISHR